MGAAGTGWGLGGGAERPAGVQGSRRAGPSTARGAGTGPLTRAREGAGSGSRAAPAAHRADVGAELLGEAEPFRLGDHVVRAGLAPEEVLALGAVGAEGAVELLQLDLAVAVHVARLERRRHVLVVQVADAQLPEGVDELAQVDLAVVVDVLLPERVQQRAPRPALEELAHRVEREFRVRAEAIELVGGLHHTRHPPAPEGRRLLRL